MIDRELRRNPGQRQETSSTSRRMAIPSSVVGVMLTISENALKELNRIQEETVKAMQDDQKFYWR